jgi:hypothetical protein
MSDEIVDKARLNALIVRNIADIEAAYAKANDEIKTELEEATDAIFQKVAKMRDGWKTANSNTLESCWLAPIEWKSNDDEETDSYDLYLGLYPVFGTDDTWLSRFANERSDKCAIFIWSHLLSDNKLRKLSRSTEFEHLAEQLLPFGFTYDKKGGWTALMISIDQEKLALGFENEDISSALEPIERALENIIKARPILDKIVALIRANA